MHCGAVFVCGGAHLPTDWQSSAEKNREALCAVFSPAWVGDSFGRGGGASIAGDGAPDFAGALPLDCRRTELSTPSRHVRTRTAHQSKSSVVDAFRIPERHTATHVFVNVLPSSGRIYGVRAGDRQE